MNDTGNALKSSCYCLEVLLDELEVDMIKAFLSGTIISLGIVGIFQGQSSANMQELYENDKCKYFFENDYCIAPDGSIWDMGNLGPYGHPRPNLSDQVVLVL